MKIGILTQPLANNYGGILQNFALQSVLRKLGHQTETINIPYTRRSENSNVLRTLWRFFKKSKGDQQIVFCNANKQINFFNTPTKEQQRFIRQYLNVITPTEQVDEAFFKRMRFDAVIVGSDQVWRKAFSPHLPTYFLEGVPDQVKKIAYAVSFGCSNIDIEIEEIPYYQKLAQKFDAISVREESGIAICREKFQVDAEWVLDPTLLLSANEYRQFFKINENKPQKCVAVYLLDRDSRKEELVNNICKKNSLTPCYIGVPTRQGFPSIESWIKSIDEADYVITDSFHGTAFSVIFEKKFISLSNSGRGNDRMMSLLNLLKIENRLFDPYQNSNVEIPCENIDYSKVHERLSHWQKKSIDFLTDNLN